MVSQGYRNLLHPINKTWTKEGIGGFFHGLTPSLAQIALNAGKDKFRSEICDLSIQFSNLPLKLFTPNDNTRYNIYKSVKNWQSGILKTIWSHILPFNLLFKIGFKKFNFLVSNSLLITG